MSGKEIKGTRTEKEYQDEIIMLKDEIEKLHREKRVLAIENKQLMEKLGESEARRFEGR